MQCTSSGRRQRRASRAAWTAVALSVDTAILFQDGGVLLLVEGMAADSCSWGEGSRELLRQRTSLVGCHADARVRLR